jgi:beta-glucosidase/6-phospho-beta-glucosidase/beta-galactosidase
MSTFNTFFIGGYECADHINRSGERVNLLKETQHDIRVRQDYRDLLTLGIRTVREGVCWSSVETAPYLFDFTEVKNRIQAADELGIQIIWDLCHFGYPDGIYPTHPHFNFRFIALCEAFALFHKSATKQQLFVVPINEISFLSWHSGDVRGTVPFAVNNGWDIKYHLCKAAILGITMLKDIDPDCRIVLVEPLIKIHPGYETNLEHIDNLNGHQFQAMDIIAGRMCPELGGKEEYLDILGFNYYWNSQWDHGIGSLDWPEQELPRRTGIADLLEMAYMRYGKPLFLSETGHFGVGRAPWMDEVTAECLKALHRGIPLLGACIYPVTDRPDWDDLTVYHDCGIWDLDENKDRVPHTPAIISIICGQEKLNNYLKPQKPDNSYYTPVFAGGYTENNAIKIGKRALGIDF